MYYRPRNWSEVLLRLRSKISLVLLLFSVTVLTACDGPLKLLTGGGPNVAANIQAGAKNSQTVGSSDAVEQTIRNSKANTIEQTSNATQVRTDAVDSVQITNIEPWMIILIAILAGFLIPSPKEIYRMVRTWFYK